MIGTEKHSALTLCDALDLCEQSRSLRVRPRAPSPATIDFLGSLIEHGPQAFRRYRSALLDFVSAFPGAGSVYAWAEHAHEHPESLDVHVLRLAKGVIVALVADSAPRDATFVPPERPPWLVPEEWAELAYWTDIVVERDMDAIAAWHWFRAAGVACAYVLDELRERYAISYLVYRITQNETIDTGKLPGWRLEGLRHDWLNHDPTALGQLARAIVYGRVAHGGRYVAHSDTKEIVNVALGAVIHKYQERFKDWRDPDFGLWLAAHAGQFQSVKLAVTHDWLDELKAMKRKKRHRDNEVPYGLLAYGLSDDGDENDWQPEAAESWQTSPHRDVLLNGLGPDTAVSAAADNAYAHPIVENSGVEESRDDATLAALGRPQRVVRFYLDAFRRGEEEPFQKEIAASLGVTEKTVYNDLRILRTAHRDFLYEWARGDQGHASGRCSREEIRRLYNEEFKQSFRRAYRRPWRDPSVLAEGERAGWRQTDCGDRPEPSEWKNRRRAHRSSECVATTAPTLRVFCLRQRAHLIHALRIKAEPRARPSRSTRPRWIHYDDFTADLIVPPAPPPLRGSWWVQAPRENFDAVAAAVRASRAKWPAMSGVIGLCPWRRSMWASTNPSTW